MTKITAKMIQKALSESRFNPKADTPLSVICQTTDNVGYYELRAVELIQEARRCNGAIYMEKIKLAISLLALAKAERTLEAAQTKT